MEQGTDYMDEVKDLFSNKLDADEIRKLQDALKAEENREGFKIAYTVWRQLAIRFDRAFNPSKAWIKLPFAQDRPAFTTYLARIAAVFVLLLNVGIICWWLFGTQEKSDAGTLVEAPKGSSTHIILPDSTDVWLNAGSRLHYDSDYTRQRRITLEGEAVFDVTPDPENPFMVQCGDFQAKVLGTVFEIKAYAGDADILLTVVEGLVQAATGKATVNVEPQQQIAVDRQTREIRYQTVNTEHVASWKNGRYFFHNCTFAEICKQLERSFDVNIIINRPGLANEIFYVDFIRGETPDKMLKIMDVENNWTYTVNGKSITID